MRRLYSLSIYFYSLAIRLATFKNKKAKLWVEGRKNTFDFLTKKCKDNQEIIWIHCASLGEFEQGRPLISSIKERKPEYKILLTFFSPSGYEIQKNFALADIITYLPIDTISNAKKFIHIVQPKYIFFIKYEYWFNYINEAFKQKIPFYIVSSIFRKNHYFFRFYAKWFQKNLNQISYFFLQNQESKDLLNSIGITQCDVYGDTRFDTVAALEKKNNPIIEKFIENSTPIIAGSTWYEDEKIIGSFIHRNKTKWIIVPHEIDEKHLNQIRNLFSQSECIFYSEITPNTIINNYKILIIDKIGILRYLYHYATIAYIGGGFGKGIHNILEAATYGLAVVFGPNYKKFQEARDLIAQQAAFSIQNEKDLENILQKLLNDTSFHLQASKAAKEYIFSQKGTSKKIFSFVFEN